MLDLIACLNAPTSSQSQFQKLGLEFHRTEIAGEIQERQKSKHHQTADKNAILRTLFLLRHF